jgi:hypothetical protein
VLISWRLEIAFPVVNPPFISITNAVSQSVTTNVAGDDVVYFAVDLPCYSGLVTNTLSNITGAGGLDLIFNQFTLPTNGPNDVLLLANEIGTGSSVLTIGSPPLTTLTRYYLGVRNTNPGQSNQFELRIDFACATTNTFPLLTTNGYCTNIIAAPSVDYYRYQMPPGVLAVRFETYGADGNVDMTVQANGVPSTGSGLSNTQPGTANELVQVMTNYPPSNPVNPTTWFIAIRNQDAATVNYCLKITEIYDITPLTLNVGLSQTIQSNGIQYYVVNIDSNYCGVFFNSTNHNLPVNLLHYINYGRLPSTLDYAYTGTALPGGIPRAIGPLPTNHPGGEWFIEVVNTNAVAMNFTMLVSTNSCFAPIAPVIKVDISSYSTNGFLLRWDAPISEQYQVQYTDSLLPANWQTIPDIVTSGTGNFIYTNIGVMTNAQRFYRLLRVP